MKSRALVVSSRARKATAGAQSLVGGVTLVRYRYLMSEPGGREGCIVFSHHQYIMSASYESTGVEDLYQLLSEEVQSQHCKLDSLAWLLSGSEKVGRLSNVKLKPEEKYFIAGIVPL